VPNFSGEIFKPDDVRREFEEERHRLEVEAANERLEKVVATSGRRLSCADWGMVVGVSGSVAGEFYFMVIS